MIITAIVIGVIAIVFAVARQTDWAISTPNKKYQDVLAALSVFGITGALVFWLVIPSLMRWQISGREATIIGLIIYSVIIVVTWSILKKYLPDLMEIKTGEIAVGCVMIMALIIYTYFSVPNVYFDQKTGESKVWLDEKNKIYYSIGYNPETGEPLHLATKDEIKKLAASKTATASAPADYPLCAGPESYNDLKSGAMQIKVPLHPDCWSGWVVMPNYKFKFRFSSPGKLEFKFLEGKRILFSAADPPALIGDIGNSYFQLRGDGETIITVEKL